MILDMESLFSDKQAITATAVSTNTLDFGPAGTPINGTAPVARDLGAGVATPLLIQVTQAFAGGTSVKVDMEVSDAEDFASSEVVSSSAVVVTADLKPGYKFPPQYLPVGVNKRYARLNYTVVGAMTAGAITAGLTCGIQTNG